MTFNNYEKKIYLVRLNPDKIYGLPDFDRYKVLMDIDFEVEEMPASCCSPPMYVHAKGNSDRYCMFHAGELIFVED